MGPDMRRDQGPKALEGLASTAVSQDFALGYMPQLDSQRAFAVAGVMVHHLLDRSLLPEVLSADWGPAGVRLFFVLSGFLITSLLLEARNALDQRKQGFRYTITRFYVRRTLRIFPLYYFVLILTLLFAPPASTDWADPSARSQLPWLATYTYNLYVSAIGAWPHYFGHFWTLSVEEQYYLLWPWVVLLARHSRLPVIALGLCALGPIYRTVAVAGGFGEVATYAFPLANLDTLGMGSLLATITGGRAASARTEIVLRWTSLPLGVIGVFLVHDTQLQPVLTDSMLGLVFVWLVAAASRGLGWFGRYILESQPLVFTGRISYGLYIYHMFPAYLLPGVLAGLGIEVDKKGYIDFALSALSTYLVACISWYFLEAPLNRLKRRFRAGQSSKLGIREIGP